MAEERKERGRKGWWRREDRARIYLYHKMTEFHFRFRDAAFQGCPCPMQSCPKNVDTGALIGNGKGAPVISGTGPSLPPSALVGPPSPARGLAGLAPPHGANAWDTERVQLNASHRNLNQNQPTSVPPPSHNLVGGPHSRPQGQDCRTNNKVSIVRYRFCIVLTQISIHAKKDLERNIDWFELRHRCYKLIATDNMHLLRDILL